MATLVLLFLGLWLFTICDVAATDSARCRTLPKPVWLVVALLLPGLGLVMWFVLGRPRGATSTRSGGAARPRRPGTGNRFDRPAAKPPRPGRRPGRHGPTLVPFDEQQPVGIEEANARRARSEELNRKLEEWEAEQRRKQQGGGSSSSA